MAGRFKFVALGVIVLGLALGVVFGLGVKYGQGKQPESTGGLTQQQINQILDIYRIIYNKGMNISQALEFIEEELPATDARDEILTFIRESGRGVIKRYIKGAMEED